MFRISHKKSLLKAAALTVLACVLFSQVEIFGAKGGSKDKKGYVLKFDGFQSRSSFQNQFMYQPGVLYKGSFNQLQRSAQQTTLSSIITYQKGNTIFIMPYKHKVSKFKTPEAPKY
ncbi:MAG: hypothetical protein MUF29_04645 [Chitinophagaceae bacterium]|jgi:hypothetical protein|nr:hypothetical protein [Chitinophagaceae bacterium]